MTTGRPARRTTAQEGLTTDELQVVAAWKDYKAGSDPNRVITGGKLMTRRGKIYYDPSPETPEGRVCIGRTIMPATKEAYTGHTMVPTEIQQAVARHAHAVDSSPRDHQ